MEDETQTSNTRLPQTVDEEPPSWLDTHLPTRPTKAKPSSAVTLEAKDQSIPCQKAVRPTPSVTPTTQEKPRPSSAVTLEASNQRTSCQKTVRPAPSVTPTTQKQHKRYFNGSKPSRHRKIASRPTSIPSFVPVLQGLDQVQFGEEAGQAASSAVPSKKRRTQGNSSPSKRCS